MINFQMQSISMFNVSSEFCKALAATFEAKTRSGYRFVFDNTSCSTSCLSVFVPFIQHAVCVRVLMIN